MAGQAGAARRRRLCLPAAAGAAYARFRWPEQCARGRGVLLLPAKFKHQAPTSSPSPTTCSRRPGRVCTATALWPLASQAATRTVQPATGAGSGSAPALAILDFVLSEPVQCLLPVPLNNLSNEL